MSERIRKLMKETIKKWTIVLQCGGYDLALVQIKRGIIQSDFLSSLLFIISLIPRSECYANHEIKSKGIHLTDQIGLIGLCGRNISNFYVAKVRNLKVVFVLFRH